MTISLALEDFLPEGDPASGPILPSFAPAPPEPVAEDPAPEFPDAYDLGYETGWAARDLELAAENAAIAAEFREALHALSFPLEEARRQVFAAVTPLLEAVVNRILPDMARRVWGEAVVSALTEAIVDAAGQPVTVFLDPDSLEKLSPYLRDTCQGPFTLTPDPLLGPGQAWFDSAPRETLFDQNQLLEVIRARIAAAMQEYTRETAHG